MTIEIYEPASTIQRRFPWHDLTSVNMVGNTESEEGLTSQQMLQSAGLDWDVAARPMWRRLSDGTFIQDEKEREVYRVDTEQKLGTVRGRYELFSNREAFAFGDALVEQGSGAWVTAGQLHGGSRVFMTMRLGEGFEVLDGDKYESYLFIRTGHGDGTSVSASVIPFRLWCLNQSSLARREARSSWAVPHTTTVNRRLEEAREALRLTADYEQSIKKLAEQLVQVKLTDERAKLLITSLLPENRSRRDEMVDEIIANYHESATVEPYRGTGYGLLNGLTEYMDHIKRQNSASARFYSITSGEGAKYRNELVQHLLQLAA